MKECARHGDQTRSHLHAKRTRFRSSCRACYKGLVSAQIVHARGNQLVSQLLLKPSDALHTQCRHTEHLHEEV